MTTVLNYFVSVMIQEDEYQYFRQAINKLKDEKLELLQSLTVNLSNDEGNDLKGILLCQKMLNQPENKAFRKIVKVKIKNH